ncbi:hypothetical protein JCM19231_5197 [Vibrio ishigakensis]|uniref:Uncharacterized protein n=1 Tax=Vibrio ishigakensis TaxID=1481914 RepID=A0A0B8NZZ3_9VIBR|nr:hypothetical protein JCM19231_5197 [Vibrio ishigakensis]
MTGWNYVWPVDDERHSDTAFIGIAFEVGEIEKIGSFDRCQ